ncbi:MAG: oligosaccharide flippase family protein, partial [Dysgonamonadaceae bacterium]|nr:oligosaccharide flippase family protein [Dysgonamonadaceae bacterium]
MKQSIAADATRLTIAKGITLIISLASIMLLSRFRTLEEYGTYSQLLMVVNLTTTIFMLGLPNSINFFLARAETDEEKQKFLSVYYSLNAVLSFVTGLILVLSASLIVGYFDNALIKKFIYFLAVFPWTRIVLASIQNVYIVYKKSSQL